MSMLLLTVDQAARQLGVHPRTVLRYIREERLPATKIGKAYRIEQARLDAFAGVEQDRGGAPVGARATCVVDIADAAPERAQRLAAFINAAAMGGEGGSAALQVSTVYDPGTRIVKVFVVAPVSDAARLLEMVSLQLELTHE